MKKMDYRTPSELLDLLGRLVRQRRIQLNLDQAAAAARAGVSVRSWRDLELGGGSTLDTFVRAAKALSISDRLDLLVPPTPTVSPIAMANAKRKEPQRVRMSFAEVAKQYRRTLSELAEVRSRGKRKPKAKGPAP